MISKSVSPAIGKGLASQVGRGKISYNINGEYQWGRGPGKDK